MLGGESHASQGSTQPKTSPEGGAPDGSSGVRVRRQYPKATPKVPKMINSVFAIVTVNDGR